MKSHLVIKREQGYKNKRIAQSVGIAVAKTSFDMMLDIKNQAFMVSWNKPFMLDRAGSDLFLYFGKTPKNIDELKVIANDAAHIEFENLKTSYEGELPVRKYEDSEIIATVTALTTKNFLMSKQTDFYAVHRKVDNIDNIWKRMFVEQYSTDILLGLAKQRAQEIFEEKSVSSQNQTAILGNIKLYWKELTDLEAALYSSR